MSATCDVTIFMELFGLNSDNNFISKETDGTTPTLQNKSNGVIAVADTDQVLDLGSITTVSVLAIKAIDYDLYVDVDYVSSFDANFTN